MAVIVDSAAMAPTTVAIPVLDLGPWLPWPIECIPTCCSDANPPKYPATTYEAYLAWFTGGNHRASEGVRP
jgi:hypothetical protein